MLLEGNSIKERGISFLFLRVSCLLVTVGGLTLALLSWCTEKNDKDLAFRIIVVNCNLIFFPISSFFIFIPFSYLDL